MTVREGWPPFQMWQQLTPPQETPDGQRRGSCWASPSPSPTPFRCGGCCVPPSGPLRMRWPSRSRARANERHRDHLTAAIRPRPRRRHLHHADARRRLRQPAQVVNVKLAATHEGVGGYLWVDFDPDTARAAADQLIAAADKCEGVGE